MNKQNTHFDNNMNRQKSRAIKIFIIVYSIALSNMLVAESLPQYDQLKHLGVSSCASSNCHGSLSKYKDSNILRNEYRTWQNDNRHSRAYTVLREEKSTEIARKLGLKNAYEAKECLDCHADNIPRKLQGKKFQISDGIGCESCHGGAEKYIKSHTNKNISHQDNIKQGLYPTELPEQRAKLCLSCHYGNKDKFTTHRILAAGHPRLNFELESFTFTHEHYEIDEDYKKRKIAADSIKTWAIGMAQTTLANVAIFRGPFFSKSGLFPEIALFDCHSCHHSMSIKRWKTRSAIKNLPVGAMRINDNYLMMLNVITRSISISEGKNLFQEITKLHDATLTSKQMLIKQADKLRKQIENFYQTLKKTIYNRKLTRKIRNQLLEDGVAGEFRDYAGAEQVFYALTLLNLAIADNDPLKSEMDRLFNSLKDEDKYDPEVFIKILKQISDKR